jgi:hypothetical protein
MADQLQGGADLIDSLTENDALFIPILVHKRIDTMQMRALGKKRIRFRGRDYKVALLRCGGSIDTMC